MAIDFAPQFDFEPEQTQTPSMIHDNTLTGPDARIGMISSVGQQALETALPSPNALQPLQPTASNPAMAGAQAALQTLRDPTRISPTISLPGQVAGQKVTDVTTPYIGKYPAKAAGFATSILLDPQTYVGAAFTKLAPEEKIAEEIGSHTGFFSKLAGLFKRKPSTDEVSTATENLRDTLKSTRAQIGKELEDVKVRAGVPKLTEDQEIEALAKGDKRPSSPTDLAQEWHTYQNARSIVKETQVLKPGDTVLVKGEGLPDQVLKHKGPTMSDSPDALKQMGFSDEEIKNAKQPIFDLSQDISGHPKNSTVTLQTLKDAGYKFPDKELSDPGKELGYLIDLKQRLGESIKPALSADGKVIQKAGDVETRRAKILGNRIEERIKEIPGGDIISAHNKKYSQVAQVFGDLQKQLSKPGQSEDFLRRILLSKSGKAADYRASLAKLEQLSGKPILSSLTKMFEAQMAGPTWEELKHPIAATLKEVAPHIGSISRGLGRGVAKVGFPMARGFQMTDDNMGELQRLRGQLNAQ